MNRVSVDFILTEFKRLLPDEEAIARSLREIRGRPILCVDGSTRSVSEDLRPEIIERSYCTGEDQPEYSMAILVGFRSSEDRLICILAICYSSTGEVGEVKILERLP